ncbi:MAG TPA: helical backbone metal receptor [Pyrinomonadaceae bacterium]|jgi:iron complex transport system substrate-binding protein
MKRILFERQFAAFVFVALLLLSSACGGGGRAPQLAGEQASKNETSAPQRIISLSPNTTEILYGVGAFARVVAVSDYCDYPPEAKNLPRIGGWQNINLERVASFKPDLIIFAGAQAPFVQDRLEALGIRTLSVPSRSLEDVFTSIDAIGRATGNVREAQALAERTRAQIEEVRSRVRDLPKRRVLCVVDRVPGTLRDLYSASHGTFFVQLIEAAGGESIAPPAEGGWGKITKEAVVALNPEIIIDMAQQSSQGSKLGEDPQAVWRELSTVSAVREGRVYSLKETSVLHPSQFVGDTARRFAELIHPEAFKDNAPPPQARNEATPQPGNEATP